MSEILPIADRMYALPRPQLSNIFGSIIRKTWSTVVLVTVAFNLVPSILICWYTTDPDFKASRALSYLVAQPLALLSNGVFSVLVVFFCLAGTGGWGGKELRGRIPSVLLSFIAFNIAVGLPEIAKLVLNVSSPTYARAFSALTAFGNVAARAGAIFAFGLFLPTLFEGGMFVTALRRSYRYIAGSRFILLMLYAVFCAVELLPLPIVWLTHLAASVMVENPKYGLVLDYSIAKGISVVFEAGWLVLLTAFYLRARIGVHAHELEATIGEFD